MYRNELHYQNRIELLTNRTGKENAKIVAKLKREIKKLEEKE